MRDLDGNWGREGKHGGRGERSNKQTIILRGKKSYRCEVGEGDCQGSNTFLSKTIRLDYGEAA